MKFGGLVTTYILQETAACLQQLSLKHWSLSTTLHEVTFQRQLVIHTWISQTLVTIFNEIACWDRRHLSMTRKERCTVIWNSLILQIHILWFCRRFPTGRPNHHLLLLDIQTHTYLNLPLYVYFYYGDHPAVGSQISSCYQKIKTQRWP